MRRLDRKLSKLESLHFVSGVYDAKGSSYTHFEVRCKKHADICTLLNLYLPL